MWGSTTVDALKIDVEGAEDIVLAPFLRDARVAAPAADLIEDTRGFWSIDLFALLAVVRVHRAGTQPPERGAVAFRVEGGGGWREEMAETTATVLRLRRTRARLARVADWLVVGVAVAMPWSIPIWQILTVAWLFALIPTLEVVPVRA